MNNSETITRYFVFTCRYPDCNEHVPVELFFMQRDFSLGMFHPGKLDEGWRYEVSLCDFVCTFCRRLNHVLIQDCVKEMSRQEYESELSSLEERVMEARNVVGSHFAQALPGNT